MKLVRLYPHITEAQNLMIRKDDYGGRLDIKCSKLHPALCKFLVKHFNPWTCKLVFPGRGSIPATEKSVQEVMGVPMGPVKVIYGKDADAVKFMREQFGSTRKKQPIMTSLEEFFLTFAMCSVLAPIPRVFPSLIEIKGAKDLNMCKFVIMTLCKVLKPGGEKEQVTPCLLYLMVTLA
jgi:hypothetical protein